MKEKAIKKWKSQIVAPKEHWGSEYFKKNPIRCVTASLTSLGMAAIFAYHFHIEYGPNFDIQSLASTIFYAAFVGLCLFATCSLVISFPAYFVGSYALSGEKEKSRLDDKIITSFILSGLAFLVFFAFIFLATEFDLPPQAAILLPLALMLAYLLCKGVGASAQACLATAFAHHKPARWRDWRWSIFWAALGSAFSSWREKNARALKLVAFMVMIFLLQVFPVQIYFILMRDAPSLNETTVDWSLVWRQLLLISVTIQGTGFYLTKAWRCITVNRAHRFYSLILFLVAPFLVTFFGGNPSFFPCSVAYMLKIGNFATSEITLTPAGCDIVAGKGGHACTQAADAKNKLYGAYVMSRIGTEVYLKMTSAKGGPLSCIYLPAKEVLGMKADETKRFYNARSVAKFLYGDTKPADETRPERCPA
jgi:hypothetical protein